MSVYVHLCVCVCVRVHACMCVSICMCDVSVIVKRSRLPPCVEDGHCTGPPVILLLLLVQRYLSSSRFLQAARLHPPSALMVVFVAVFQMWEKGIELCDELAGLYRDELFDYLSLSKILVSSCWCPPVCLPSVIVVPAQQGLRLENVTSTFAAPAV